MIFSKIFIKYQENITHINYQALSLRRKIHEGFTSLEARVPANLQKTELGTEEWLLIFAFGSHVGVGVCMWWSSEGLCAETIIGQKQKC